MELVFGDAFLSIPLSKRGPQSKFAREIEALKHTISRHSTDNILIDLPMKTSNHEDYDIDEQYVTLKRLVLGHLKLRARFDELPELQL